MQEYLNNNIADNGRINIIISEILNIMADKDSDLSYILKQGSGEKKILRNTENPRGINL